MPDVQTTSPSPTVRATTPRVVGRWMVTCAGFPLGGYAAYLTIGAVDSLVTALLGGIITGAVLGAVQAWGLGRNRPPVAAWVLATALGMMIGLTLGSALVGYGTSLADLATQGAVTGAVVGLAQGVVLLPRLGRLALAWPVHLGAAWAAGWAVTTSVGVEVDLQFTVFGSAGAVTVAVLTLVLPAALDRTRQENRS